MPGFVTFSEAQKRAGVSYPTLRDRVRRGELVIYANPKDRRSRLVAVDDLDRLMTTPRPMSAQDGDRVPVA
jgi:hypothetical protein